MSDGASAPAPAVAAPSKARLAAEARKARIQARGGDGLAKLASTARGEEGKILFDTTPPIARTPSSSSVSSSLSKLPPPATSTSSPLNDTSLPSQDDFMRSMFESMGQSGMGAEGGNDMFKQMMEQMQGGAGGAGMPPFGGAGGDGSNPFVSPQQSYSTRKSTMDKIFTLVHFLSMVGLVLFTLLWWEPTVAARTLRPIGIYEGKGFVRWNEQGFGKDLPVFYAFITLSLILQSTRLLLFSQRPPPSSLLSLASPFLPFLPPTWKSYLITASRYISIVSQGTNDFCLLVFGIGVGRWIQGKRYDNNGIYW